MDIIPDTVKEIILSYIPRCPYCLSYVQNDDLIPLSTSNNICIQCVHLITHMNKDNIFESIHVPIQKLLSNEKPKGVRYKVELDNKNQIKNRMELFINIHRIVYMYDIYGYEMKTWCKQHIEIIFYTNVDKK